MVKEETEISEEKGEKPRLELLKSTGLYNIELCNPVKDQINKIKVCGPNIEINPCNPIERIKCIPNASLVPYLPCRPVICVPAVEHCDPNRPCEPDTCDPDVSCDPNTTTCEPGSPCDPDNCDPIFQCDPTCDPQCDPANSPQFRCKPFFVDFYRRQSIRRGSASRINEIAALIKRLTLEIEDLKRKIEQK